MARATISAGIDVGSTCVKAVIHDGSTVRGRAVIPVRGLYQDCAQRAMAQALDEARLSEHESVLSCATGFAAASAPWASMTRSLVSCLTMGAFAVFPEPMTLVDLGGEDPKVVTIDAEGHRASVNSLRKCAAGSGVFLDLVARRLDVHPSQLQALASQARRAAPIGSYCSVFALNQVDEQLRDGASPAEVAAGAIASVAERVFEAGGFSLPLMVSGGVAEYYPDVLQGLSRLTGLEVRALPEPITIAALGAALQARQALVAIG